MDTTVNYGFPIPKADASDFMVPDLWRPAIIGIDTELKNQDTRLDALELAPVGPTAGIVTAAANFSVSLGNGFKMHNGHVVQLDIRIKRTGAQIAVGNVGNVLMATLDAAWRPVATVGLATTAFGGGADAYIDTAGNISLAALEIAWATNGEISFSAFFMR